MREEVNPGIRWTIAGPADINRDGRPEILLQNIDAGRLAYWTYTDRLDLYG